MSYGGSYNMKNVSREKEDTDDNPESSTRCKGRNAY